MMHFKKGLGWKACYDDERNLYTAQTSWRGDYHLYEINEEIWNQLGESDLDADELIHSGRHLYYSEDSPIGPPTDMVIDENGLYFLILSSKLEHSHRSDGPRPGETTHTCLLFTKGRKEVPFSCFIFLL